MESAASRRRRELRDPSIAMILNWVWRQWSEASGARLVPLEVIDLCCDFIITLTLHREFFDLLYYKTRLPEEVARTYLHQIVRRVENMPYLVKLHPGQLLLDANLKLHVFDGGRKCTVRTYDAPELLFASSEQLKGIDRSKSVVFSIGVIMFIVLVGSIPFEVAHDSDPWYKRFTRKPTKFWRAFEAQGRVRQRIRPEVKSLLTQMLCSADKRLQLEQVKEHLFYAMPVHKTSEGLITHLKTVYERNEKERAKFIRKNYGSLLKVSDCTIGKKFPITGQAELFPQNETEGIFDAYCGEAARMQQDYVLQALVYIIEERCRGKVECDTVSQCLVCRVTTRRCTVKFGVKLYRSRRWEEAVQSLDASDLEEEERHVKSTPLYVIKFYCMEGDSWEFVRIKNKHLLACSDVVSGFRKIHKDIMRTPPPSPKYSKDGL